MSDFKTLFRKAQANRGVVSSKQQIKKLKSQKPELRVPVLERNTPSRQGGESDFKDIQAGSKTGVEESLSSSGTGEQLLELKSGDRKRGRERDGDELLMPPPPALRQAVGGGQKVPEDVLMPPPPPKPPQALSMMGGSNQIQSGNMQPEMDRSVVQNWTESNIISHSAVRQEHPPGELPKGFYEDKEADSMARGIKPRAKSDKEAEYAKFQNEMDSSLQELAKAEAVDQEEMAKNREDLERFEQQSRLEMVSRLREKKRSKLTDPQEGGVIDSVVHGQNRMELPEFESDEDSVSSEESKLTDWRAKAV